MGSSILSLHKTMNTSAKIILFCYLICSPTVFSMALPDPQTFGQFDALEERQLEIPDNVLEVAAVGFLAGLAGQLLFSPTTTTTTTTAATTTTSNATSTG